MRSVLVCAFGIMALQAASCSAPMPGHIDLAGGEVHFSDPVNPALAGVSLVVPPGALTQAADLQIVACDGLAMGDESIAGPCVRFLPADLVFAIPATLTIPYQPEVTTPQTELAIKTRFRTLFSSIALGALRVDAGKKTLTTSVNNLGDYQAITTLPPAPPPTKDVDILFVIDNSPAMAEKQKALVQNIPAFIRQLDDAGANYHIGIATSDVGSDISPGTQWGGNIGKCDTFEGDDGVLQAVACDSRTDVTSDARNACNRMCPDSKFVPNDGQHFISKVNGVTNIPAALELDPMTGKMVDRGPAHAFQCMALVGDSGCGIEGQLAGARRALDGHRTENAGFLRSNSVLAVFFLTDEDDCSVQLARRGENNPVTQDCATPDQNANAECFNVDYRCLARSVKCNEPMNVAGVKTGCQERPGNYLDPTSSYVTFLQSLRPASQLVVRGVWALPTLTAGGRLIVSRGGGGTTTPFLNRGYGPDATCTYSGNAAIVGQAQLRLSKFAAGFGKDAMGQPLASESSICDLDNYASVLNQFARSIVSQLKP